MLTYCPLPGTWLPSLFPREVISRSLIPQVPRFRAGRNIFRNIFPLCSPQLKVGYWLFKYSRTCLKWPLKKKTKIGFQDRILLNAGQKYCRMLQGEHSAILSTFIKLPFVIKIFVLSIFVWPLKTGLTVL